MAWWNLAAAIAAPIVSNLFSSKPKAQPPPPPPMPELPPPPPTLTLDEAAAQAQQVLDPLYNRMLNETLHNIDTHNMARGFYGQMPGDAFKGARAQDLELQRTGQIANLTTQMHGLSQEQALQAQQMAAQYALGQQQNWLAQQQMQQNQWGNLTGGFANLAGGLATFRNAFPGNPISRWLSGPEGDPGKNLNNVGDVLNQGFTLNPGGFNFGSTSHNFANTGAGNLTNPFVIR